MEESIFFKYKITTDTGVEKTFRINLNPKDLSIIKADIQNHPSWTELSCCQCPNCPLDLKETAYCPIAAQLIDIIKFLKDLLSCAEVDVTIETSRRNYFKHTDLQSVAGSMIGIIMVTSDCPIMDKLRPMVALHLPFASVEETEYRAMSMYLLAQYFISLKGFMSKPDWKMKNLNKIYEDVNIVNSAFIKRLKQIQNIEDSSLNAIIKLDCFAQSINLSLSQQSLEHIESIFKAYL